MGSCETGLERDVHGNVVYVQRLLNGIKDAFVYHIVFESHGSQEDFEINTFYMLMFALNNI